MTVHTLIIGMIEDLLMTQTRRKKTNKVQEI